MAPTPASSLADVGMSRSIMGSKWIAEKYEVELERAVGDCRTLLDIGCGDNSPIRHFSRRIHAVGVDAWEPSLGLSRERGIHSEYVQMDLREVGRRFRPKSFDCVLLSDVIEHFAPDEGGRLLSEWETIARRRIIVFTPNGFQPQGNEEENPWQMHRSGWTVQEMRGRGYRVLGMRGWKPLRGPYARVRFPPKFLWLFISNLTQSWVRSRPQCAYQLLCIKDIPPAS